MRPHRLLRQLAGAARDRPRPRDRPLRRSQLRAGRVVVLELRDRGVRRRSRAGPTAEPSGRPAGSGSGGAGATGLVRPPALTRAPCESRLTPVRDAELTCERGTLRLVYRWLVA